MELVALNVLILNNVVDPEKKFGTVSYNIPQNNNNNVLMAVTFLILIYRVFKLEY